MTAKKNAKPRSGGDFAVRFITADVGCLDFEVSPFGQLGATCYNDPFPDMVRWLEAIAEGAEIARWLIDYEGGAYQLIFSAAADLWMSETSAQLVFTLGSDDFSGKAASCLVRRREVIEAFYRGFRSFVTSDQYDPIAWEWRWGPHATIDDIPEDEPSWEGECLTNLRSSKIESYLAIQPEQLILIKPSPYDRRSVRDD